MGRQFRSHLPEPEIPGVSIQARPPNLGDSILSSDPLFSASLPNLSDLQSKVGTEPQSTDLVEETQKRMPPWLISLVVHLVVLLILVLIPRQLDWFDGISLTGSTGSDEGEVSLDIVEPEQEHMDDLAAETLLEAIAPESGASLALEPVKLPDTLDLSGMERGITSGMKGRSGSMKEALLRAYGGTAGTQEAVALGLKWLVKQQRPDGSWSLTGPYANGATNENAPAATAMAMLALLGAGNTHLEGEYRDSVKKGLYFLRDSQDDQGFFSRQAMASHQRMYAQAQCSIAICELYAMTQDATLRPLAEKAIRFAEYSQSELGGWRYQPRDDSDVSVTGWFVMALMSGKMGGLAVSEGVLKNVGKFLDSVQFESGALYSYTSREQGPSLSMTAEALLCREYLGWSPYEHPLQVGASVLLSKPIESEDPTGMRNYYYWYYATQTLHHMGGDYWRKWNEKMRVALPAMQTRSGSDAGSWSPQGDQWGIAGGRIYSTCFALYCLEVYYRHMPLYGFE